MSILSDLAAELGVPPDALSASLLSGSADEALTPTYLTVDPQGKVGAVFSGHVKAEGLEIAAAGTDDPVANDTDRRVYWTRTSDGAVVANIIGWTVDAVNRKDSLGLHAGLDTTNPATSSAQGNAYLAASSRNGGSADIQVLADDLGGPTEIDLFANAPSGAGSASRTLLRSDGHSDFVQNVNESVRIVRGVVTGVAGIFAGAGFTVARTPALPTGSYDVTFTTAFTALSGGPAIAIGHNSAATPISHRLTAVTNNSFSIQMFNSTTGALLDTGFRFIAIGT